MATNKLNIKLQLPDANELTASLTLRDCYPPFAEAEDAAVAAQERLEQARHRLTDQQASLAGRKAAGADADELTELLTRVEAARLVVEQREADLEVVDDLAEGIDPDARRALGAEIEARMGRLQALADELAPALEALTDLHAAIGQHVQRQSCGLRCRDDSLRWMPSPGMRGYVPRLWREKQAS